MTTSNDILRANGQLKWDRRFLQLAKLVSTWSKDPSTKCGAVIVRPDHTVLSLGFNGFPKQMSDDPLAYADRQVKYSKIIHCEVNALIHAQASVQGCTLYNWPLLCCDRCAVQMIQAGIVAVVSVKPTEDAISRWGAALDITRRFFDEAGVIWKELNSID